VVDVETGGFDAATDALLELAAVIVRMDEHGFLYPGTTVSTHVQPFKDANIEAKALEITGIDPYHPLRIAVPEKEALEQIFEEVRAAIRENECTRAILVGHNPSFDLSFINAAVERASVKRNPFHPFSSLDTVTLAAMAYGQTVLAKAAQAAEIPWDSEQAHSAAYDAQRTAELFCTIINRWHALTQVQPSEAMNSRRKFS